jgi:DNA polymerase III epsilon subunit-like protein
MVKKSQPGKKWVPDKVSGLQVNFCKIPQCPNFGKAKYTFRKPRGRPAKSTDGANRRDLYVPTGTQQAPYARCTHCNKHFPLKSNQGILEELARLNSFKRERKTEAEQTCPNPDCGNYQTVSLEAGPDYYIRFGVTKNGHQRYRCKMCKETFILAKTSRQVHSHLNRTIFEHLVNKAAIRPMCRLFKTSGRIIYDRIDFLYERCLEFVTEREKVLRDGMPIDRLYISADQQDLAINWPTRLIRKNIQLKAVAAADNRSGYVLGSFVNYDPSLDVRVVEKEAIETGDNFKPPPFRRYARAWLLDDYLREMIEGHKTVNPDKIENLREKTLALYNISVGKPDMESGEQPRDDRQLPHHGLQIHNEYTLYAFFMYLKQLLPGVGKLRFYFDRDTGMRAACMAAFVDGIKKHTVDAFFAVINRAMKRDQKETSVDQAYRKFRTLQFLYPDKKESELKLMLMLENLGKAQVLGPYDDVWVDHPLPSPAEPELKSAFLTNLNQYDIDHQAHLHLNASEHAVNQYFMSVRRSINMLERPIVSASDPGRRWYGYSSYSPDKVIKLLQILRVYYNFVELRGDGSTRAMSLGIAKKPVRVETIIYGKQYAGRKFPGVAAKLRQARYDEAQLRFQGRIKTRVEKERAKRFVRDTDPSKVLYLGAIFDQAESGNRIIELSLLDYRGNVLYHQLINPVRALSKETSDTYKIYAHMLADKPTINDEALTLQGHFMDKIVISYDMRCTTDVLPRPVVESAAGFEEYLDIQTALKMKKAPLLYLEDAARKFGFVWNDKPIRALDQAKVLRLAWNDLVGWKSDYPPEKEVKPLEQDKDKAPVQKAPKEKIQAPGTKVTKKERPRKHGPHQAKVQDKPVTESASSVSRPPDKQEEFELEFVFLDVETTGTGKDDQIVEIAIVGEAGEVLVNQLVRPTGDGVRINPGAFGKHGITMEELAGKPLLKDIEPTIIKAVRNKHVVMFKADFDLRMLTRDIRMAMGRASCCWKKFKAFRKGGGSLQAAAAAAGHVWTGKQHRALADALACREVWRYLGKFSHPDSNKSPLSGIASLEDKY